MANEEIEEFYEPDEHKDIYQRLDEIPIEEIDAANQAAKEQRAKELGLDDPDEELLKDMQAAQEKVLGKASLPVTSIDYERISREQDGPSLGTVAPRDISAVGLVPPILKHTPIVRDVFFQSGKEQVSGIMPEDNLWFTADVQGQSMPEGTEFKFLRKQDIKRQDPMSEKYGMSIDAGSDTKNIFGGTIRVPIPSGEGMRQMYVKVEGTMDEINDNIRTLRTKWREREGMDLANPEFKSTPEIPLTFTDYGLNIQAETNILNDVTGYPDNIVKMYLMRGAQKVVSPVYDIAIDMAVGEGLGYLWYLPKSAANWLNRRALATNVERADPATIEEYDKIVDEVAISRQNWADSIPSSSEILKDLIEKPTLKEYAEGQIAFNEENLARFVEGKNASFLEKFATDYAGGLAFMKVLDSLIFPIMGRGPKAAEKFVGMLRGDVTIDKTSAVGKQLSKVFKENKNLKTGKQLFLDANKGTGRTNAQLLKEWNKLAGASKDKWATQAFNTFLKVRIDKQGGWISKAVVNMGNKTRWETGVSVPAYLRNTRLGEKYASFGGLMGEEFFGPWGYMLGAFSMAGGGPIMMNTNWYTRTKTHRIGSIATIPSEFGVGFHSGLDALIFLFKGRRPITAAQYKNALAVVKREGVPDAILEEEIFRRFAIQNPEAKQATLGSFMIIDKNGEERLATPSDPEWKKLNDIGQQINSITDPIHKRRIVDTIETVLNIQNGFADEISRTGKKWLADNPGKTLTDHPLNRLGVSLFEVLDLITSRSAAEAMVEGANFGLFRGINLNHVEAAFQDRKEQLLQIGKYIEDATQYMNKYDVSETSMDLLTRLDDFTHAEIDYTSAVQTEFRTLPAVFTRLHNTASFNSGTKLTDETQFTQDYFNNDIAYQTFKNDFQKVEESVTKLEMENRKEIYLILEHMKSNPKIHSNKGRVQVYNKLVGSVNKRIRTDAGLAYKPFLRASGAKNQPPISGEDVDNLFINIESIVNASPAAKVGKEVLPVHEASTLEQVFSSSLKRSGDKFRQQIEQAGIDANKLLPVDLNDDVALYKYFLQSKGTESDNVILKALREEFGNLEIDPVAIANMDRVIRAEKNLLLSRLGKGPISKTEEGVLNKYYQIIGKSENDHGTLGALIKNNMGEDIFSSYKASTRIYAAAIAPRRWGDFNRLFEKIERVNKQIDEAGEGFDRGTPNVYTMDETEQLKTLGKMLVENPYRGDKVLREKIGTLATVNNQQKFVIASAEQADTYRVIAQMAINTHLESMFKKDMQKIVQKYGADNLKIKASGEIEELFSSLAKGGDIYNAFDELDRLSRIEKGTQVWNGEIDETGKLVFSKDTAWTKNDKNKTLSTLEDNYGTSVFLNDGSIDDIFFSKEIAHVIENNKMLKKRVQSLEVKSERYREKLFEDVTQKVDKLESNGKLLVDYVSGSIGLQRAPKDIGSSFNIDSAARELIADGTGRKIDGFIEFLVNARHSDSGKRVLKGSEQSRRGQAQAYVESIVQYQFVNDILVDSGIPRTAKDAKTGKAIVVDTMVPSLSLINQAKRKYLPILEKFMTPEQANKYIKIAEITAITGATGKIGFRSGLATEFINYPSPLSIASLMSRGMNIARHVVSPTWVGADVLIRKTRLSRAGTLRTLLLTKSSAQDRGTTVIDAVYDMLVNNNYSVKNARVLERLLPEAIYQSELTFVGFGEVNIGGYEFPVPLTPQFEYSDRYDPRPELGDQPLIARKGERSESILEKRIIADFGSMTGFRRAIEDGNAVALKNLRLIKRTPRGNRLRKELEALGLIK